MKAKLPTNKPKMAIKVTGRFNNGNKGSNVFRKIPKMIVMR
jgi:hypothetical protein